MAKRYTGYQKLDIIAGWAIFAIASLVYLLTMEPTASFWDCGEFIACGYKLIVGHPPGAPFFLILMRIFTLFAPSVAYVSVAANALSALASGATIMFLYWTIANLARRFFISEENPQLTTWQRVLVVGSSAVGALCYTFTDTFWFSAVEGEVYALSSLFTAMVFWGILKWDSVAAEPRANRWIVLIAYLMGLSIGVHLLNLLVIPAIVMVYYLRNYKFSVFGLIKSFVVGSLLLLAVMFGVIQGVVVVASWFELALVNGLGMPFFSGAILFAIIAAAGLGFLIYYTQRKRHTMANLLLLCFAMLMLGYSSYMTIIIRSLAGPTLDQNGVNNVFSLKSYLNREQYGDRPLFSGPYFNAPVENYEDTDPQYAPRDGEYKVVSRKTKVIYDARFTTLFPRMWSSNAIHQHGYRMWVDFKDSKGRPIGKRYAVRDNEGREQILYRPTFWQNLEFFFRYQLGFMYWRYFMWNFSGRQNDFQGYGQDIFQGNWISGIPIIDNPRLGDQSKLPEPYRSNKARNRYYMLPLLLGIVGLFFHFKYRRNEAWVVLTLFVMTGIAIVMYLNQKPFEPRERDYTYAASFYAFAIWVGIGVIPIAKWLGKLISAKAAIVTSIALTTLAVPVLMAQQNWDDHDRSHRFISTDFGKNMLTTVSKNGILFTYADNDTFPLWYLQEAEGFRTDVRVCNLTYLGGDWYISEMARKAYDGDPIPFGLKKEDYLEGNNDMLMVYEAIKRPLLIHDAMAFVLNEDEKTQLRTPYTVSGKMNYLPTKELYLKVDRPRVEKEVNLQFRNRVLDSMTLIPSGRYLYKNGFAMYAMMRNIDFSRQLFYSPLLPKEMYWGLNKYFVPQGLLNDILPVKDTITMVDTAAMRRNLMEKYSYQGIAHDNIYIDETCRRMIEYYILAYGDAVDGYLSYGDKQGAVRIINHCFEKLPPEKVGWSDKWLPLIAGYYEAGENQLGRDALMGYASQCLSIVSYTVDLPERLQGMGMSGLQNSLAILARLFAIARMADDKQAIEEMNTMSMATLQMPIDKLVSQQ